MKKADKSRFAQYAEHIDPSAPGAVYPLSVAESFQSGEIYEDGEAALIWHNCGFGAIIGSGTERLYEDICRLMTDAGSRRLMLFAQDETTAAYFRERPGIITGQRYFYGYGSAAPAEPSLPEGFYAAEIGASDIGKLDGRITPAFSWSSSEEFLARGKGFCIKHGDKPVSWAFSAAVSSREIDIGVETDAEFRGLGLASAAAKLMIKYALEQGKAPVWACAAGNIGSQRTAERAGFVRCCECVTIVGDKK